MVMLAIFVRRVKVWGGVNNMRVAQTIPTLPTLPYEDWCEEHDAVEDFWDNTPSCPICNIKMKKRKCMGGYAIYCDNYWKCGQRVELSEVPNNEIP